MATFYHSLGSGLSFSPVKPGDPYHGSDRSHLSFLLGGKVGFAYPYHPKGWNHFGIYEILIPDEALVFLAKDGHDVPRDEDEDWDGRCVLVTAAEAVSLAQSDERYRCEVAFAAADVVFGNPIKDFQKTLFQLIGKEFETCQEGVNYAVSLLVEKGLKFVPYFYDAGYYGISEEKTLNLTIQGYYGCELGDFSTIEEWLRNKPNMLIDLLELDESKWVLDDRPRISSSVGADRLIEKEGQLFFFSRTDDVPEILSPVPADAIFLKEEDD